MDPETVGSLVVAAGNAANVVKTVVEPIAAARNQNKDKDVAETLSQALDLANSLRFRIFQLQEEAFRLQKERDELHQQNVKLQDANAKLHQELGEGEVWTAERERYTRKEVGGTWVMVRKGEDEGIYYCVRCFQEREQANLLQQAPMALQALGQFQCTVCRRQF